MIDENKKYYGLKKFDNAKSVQNQDSFVLKILQEKTNGTFLEIGSGHPVEGNNTYLLEKQFNWTGLAIDIDKNNCSLYNENRISTCVREDALRFNYEKYLVENNFPKRIDYLQIDVDDTPRHANLLALIRIPLSNYRFNVITIEHDSIRDFTLKPMRDCQRMILSSFGYELILQGENEDFWVDKSVIPQERYQFLYSIGRIYS